MGWNHEKDEGQKSRNVVPFVQLNTIYLVSRILELRVKCSMVDHLSLYSLLYALKSLSNLNIKSHS